MSVIRKLPYIEALLASMTAANLKDLRTVLNTGGSNVNLDFEHLTAATYKNKVTPVYFKFEDNGLKTGILIWTNSMCALICYHRFQDLIIFELSPTYHTSKKINEYCDINELRRVLDDTVESTGAIDSGSAAAGTVPFADGDGGVGWDKPVDYIKGDDFSDGSAAYLVGLDSEGNLIKDELPEGIVVDQTVVEDSANAVSGGAVYDELADIKSDIIELDDTKANKDGNYATLGAGHADSAASLDTEVGVNDKTPFAYQTSGGSSDLETGMQKLNKLVGCDVVKNQLVNPASLPATQTVNGITFTNNGDGTITVNGTASADAYINWAKPTGHTGHTGLYLGWTNDIYFYNGYNLGYIEEIKEDDLYILVASGKTIDNVTIRPLLVDLTQRYGNDDVINAILGSGTDEQKLTNLLKFNANILADTTYDEGTLVSAKSAKLKTVGYNQWDEEWELGSINVSTGINETNNNAIRSKNYIKVIGGTEYYFNCNSLTGVGKIYFYDVNKNFINANYDLFDRTITLPNEVCFIKFVRNGITSYNNDICIFIYWDGSKITYEPYEEHEYELPDKTMHGVIQVDGDGNLYCDGDELLPDGTGQTRYGVVNLSTLEWTYDGGVFGSDLSSIGDKGICTKYERVDTVATQNQPDKTIQVRTGKVYIKDSSYTDATTFTTAMDGVYLVYELATPTDLTAQGTFADNIYCDDFGTMEFLDTLGNQIAGLQGADILYKANIAGFAESLYVETDGDVSKIVLENDIDDTALATRGYIKLASITGYDATKTQVLKNIEGTFTWVDEE